MQQITIPMYHIYSSKDEKDHNLEESTCQCGPKAILDKESGELFIIHKFQGKEPSDETVQNAIAMCTEDDDEVAI